MQGADANLVTILVLMGLVLAILGAFLEPVGIMMLTIPIFLPLAAAYELDPIWMGIFILIWIEFGLAMPPFGLALYVMLGNTPGKTIIDVSVAVAPYLLCTVLLVILITAYPEIVLFLPPLATR